PLLLPFVFLTPARSVCSPLSLHDALPIFVRAELGGAVQVDRVRGFIRAQRHHAPDSGVQGGVDHVLGTEHIGVDKLERVVLSGRDRKSTRLNSSHEWISYAVFCLKKKSKK